MRKLFTLVLILCLALAAMPTLAENTPAALIPENARVITVDNPYTTDEAFEAITDHSEEDMVQSDNIGNMIVVQSLSEALMMLQSGRGDVFLTIDPTARYLAAHNESLGAIAGLLPVSMHILAGQGSADLIAQINDAIAAMGEDGTLAALETTYIEALIDSDVIEAIAMPVIEGADTYKVGVSGDVPPMDYTTADGQPAGFNTALLAKLSEALGVNFELVTIESGGRFYGLESGVIDLFFWQNGFVGAIEDMETALESLSDVQVYNERYVISDAYLVTVPGWVINK